MCRVLSLSSLPSTIQHLTGPSVVFTKAAGALCVISKVCHACLDPRLPLPCGRALGRGKRRVTSRMLLSLARLVWRDGRGGVERPPLFVVLHFKALERPQGRNAPEGGHDPAVGVARACVCGGSSAPACVCRHVNAVGSYIRDPNTRGSATVRAGRLGHCQDSAHMTCKLGKRRPGAAARHEDKPRAWMLASCSLCSAAVPRTAATGTAAAPDMHGKIQSCMCIYICSACACKCGLITRGACITAEETRPPLCPGRPPRRHRRAPGRPPRICWPPSPGTVLRIRRNARKKTFS